MRPTILPLMFINLMKSISKLWQRFGEHIDKILFIVGLLLVALAVAVMVSESIASCLQQLLGLSEKYDVLKTIGFCAAGVLLVWPAWTANKCAKAMDATTKEQAKATANTEAGQRQERLKNAIEYLGYKRDSARIGGTHELFHLAKDNGDLRQTVLDILCAHIRQTTRGDDYQAEHKIKPSEEIQGLLILLFMEEHEVFEDCSINLQGSYLKGATLSQARLKRANLREAQLQGANLFRAQLQNANLREAQLQEADLNKAKLQKVNLMEAQLQKADLSKAKLQKANLMNAQLQRAHFSQAQMQGAFLDEARLQGAFLDEARLQGTSLHRAQLQEAYLPQAQMQGAFLDETQLQGADLSATQLQGADLSEAQMQGAFLNSAQLQGADLSAAQLQGADLSEAQMQEAFLAEAQMQGAFLGKARLQEAFLSYARLQGVSSQEAVSLLSSAGFKSTIRNRIGKDSDLKGIIFAGGLKEKNLDTLCEGLSNDQAQALREKLGPYVGQPVNQEDLDTLCEEAEWASLSDDQAQALREKLRPYVGQPVSHELPPDSDAKVGAYTKEEAEQWIAEYNEAMEEASRADDTADAASAPDSDKDKGN